MLGHRRPYPTHVPQRLIDIGSPRERRSWAVHLGFGLIIGLGIGVAARGFMRLLTADPEFTWSGTIFIVGLFVVFGVVQVGVVGLTLSEDGVDRLLEPSVVAGFALLTATYAATVWAVGPTFWPRLICAAPLGVALSELVDSPTDVATGRCRPVRTAVSERGSRSPVGPSALRK